jgi:hypothetical protein
VQSAFCLQLFPQGQIATLQGEKCLAEVARS